MAGSIGLAILLALLSGALPAFASLPDCTQSILQGFAPSNMTVTSATDVAAANGNPEYCDVTGSVVTSGEGAPNGLAGFGLELPASWNSKFMFVGCGGSCGTISLPVTDAKQGSAALSQGYAIAATDDGHEGSDPSWSLISPGVPNTVTLTDFNWRAVHDVHWAAEALVTRYYGGSITRRYFNGCSTGGREALTEAWKYPDDWDGIVGGDPVQSSRDGMSHIDANRGFTEPPDSVLTPAQLSFVDSQVYAQCDATDGVTDNLIQDPLRCNFNPETLLCGNSSDPNCLNQDQVNALKNYWTPLRDEAGEMVQPAWPISDLNPPNSFSFVIDWDSLNFCSLFLDCTNLAYQVYLNPSYNYADFDLHNGVIGDAALAQVDKTGWLRSVVNPEDLSTFIAHGHKLIEYDGFSDQGLPPYVTIMSYQDLARLHAFFSPRHGRDDDGRLYNNIRRNVRLFMLPGMEHCGSGPGPNEFDSITAIANWVENDIAPDGLIATHYAQNKITNPPDRTMPICAWPEQAHYNGGPVGEASSWSCPAGDDTLLKLGPAGVQAGLTMNRYRFYHPFYQPW
jgi:feruloyl esterase